jgi:hypothetical protein
MNGFTTIKALYDAGLCVVRCVEDSLNFRGKRRVGNHGAT